MKGTKSVGAMVATGITTLVMTASVAFMFLRGDGFTRVVHAQINQLAPRTVTVMRTTANGGYGDLPPGVATGLGRIGDVVSSAPVAASGAVAEDRSGRSARLSVIETTPGYAALTSTTMEWGSFLTTLRPSVVLNPSAAHVLGVGKGKPQTIWIAGLPLPLVGVTAVSGTGLQQPTAYLDIHFAPDPYRVAAVLLEARSIGAIGVVSHQASLQVTRTLAVDGLSGGVHVVDAGKLLTASEHLTGIVGSFAHDAALPGILLGGLLVGLATWVQAHRSRRSLAVQLGYGSSPRSLLVSYASHTLAGALTGNVLGSAIGVTLLVVLGNSLPTWITVLTDAALASAITLTIAELAATIGAGIFLIGRRSVESLLD
jgi:hypothetical protein